MNVLSLCDGMSCGQMALEKAGIEVREYYAAEIKEHAIRLTKHNFPNTVHIGDVNKVTYRDGVLYTENGEYKTEIDLVIFGSPCFEAGTLVITDKGYKSIEDIQVGDKVLTHKGRYRKVLATGGKIADTVELKCSGSLATRVTLNHPYYVTHKTTTRKKTKGVSTTTRHYTEPSWVQVGELKQDDMVAMPRITIEENPLNLTEEQCYLMGRYVADGYINNNKRTGPSRNNSYNHKVIYCIGKAKLDLFMSNLITYHGCVKEDRTVYKVEVINEELMNLCLLCGRGAENKLIPPEVLNLPKDLALAFLRGYLSGDGCYLEHIKKYQLTTISRQLAMGLQLLVAKCYGTASTIVNNIPKAQKYIEGRLVNQRPTYVVGFKDFIAKQDSFHTTDEHVWLRYKHQSNLQSDKHVYNLEVEEDNSYTANNLVVHNCQSFSRAMREEGRIGLEDKVRSGLFLECHRILREIDPKWFLMENVIMKPEDEQTVSSMMGVEPIRINSSLITAQLRDRLYWTNIPATMPEDKGIKLNDILNDGYCPFEKAKCLMANDSHGYYNGCNWTPIKRFHRTFYKQFSTMIFPTKEDYLRCKEIADKILAGRPPRAEYFEDYQGSEFDCARYLWKEERARLQTVPLKYIETLTEQEAADVLGDGWTVDVIAHIFKGMVQPLERQLSLFEEEKCNL